MTMKTSSKRSDSSKNKRVLRRLILPAAVLLAAGLSGCVYAPPYGYAPAPAPAYGYAYAPGYYAAPAVSVGVGFGGGYGHWHGH
jgi:hypothetical protein